MKFSISALTTFQAFADSRELVNFGSGLWVKTRARLLEWVRVGIGRNPGFAVFRVREIPPDTRAGGAMVWSVFGLVCVWMFGISSLSLP